MPQYYCSQCGNRTEPMLYESGAGASCHEEAWLMVAFCPSIPDKCKGCEMRNITEAEERELAADLAEEADAERTPAERARNNWLNRS